MIKSMTGYGRGENSAAMRRFVVEIKSVNHRYFELGIRLPKFLNPLEDKVRRRLSETASRGKVDVYIAYESYSAEDTAVKVNSPLCESYIKAYKKIIEDYSLRDEIDISLISRIPDVISVEKNVDNDGMLEELWDTLSPALESAAEGFLSMKRREGEAIRLDLLDKLDLISSLTANVEARAPDVAADYEARLRLKLQEALGAFGVDDSRLLQEVLLFADKSCVDEELTRLKSHLSQFRIILGSGGQVGKKLDFLIQEINREVNTIGSKSNDLEITRIVIELKSTLEKLREQIQNLE